MALEWLEQAHRDPSLESLFIDEDPRFVNLRSHPIFLRLLAQAGA